jgi:hypothetical protein
MGTSKKITIWSDNGDFKRNNKGEIIILKLNKKEIKI